MNQRKSQVVAGALSFLKKTQGVDYADGRIVEKREEELFFRSGEGAREIVRYDRGVGFRVLYKGSWGFAATSELKEEAIYRCAREALEIAQASFVCQKEKVVLSEEEVAQDKYTTPYVLSPFSVSSEEKKAYLEKVASKLKGKYVKSALCFLNFFETKKWFLSTEGAFIEQVILEAGGGMEVMAGRDGEVQKRSFPNAYGNTMTGGYEVIERLGMEEAAPQVVAEAEALLFAPPCPEGETDLILLPPQLCLQIHESCGHAVELDRVFGMETSFAGETFLQPELRGSYRYGSPCVTIVADTELPGGLGTFKYDDEGVKGKKLVLVSEGIFRNYLSSRETAKKLKLSSSGAARAESWNHIPLIRMVNVYLQPGTVSFAELLSSVKKGVLMDINKSWSIDSKRLQFQFGCEAAWEIKNGKLGRLFKNPVYTGITPLFWRACESVASQEHFQLYGLLHCGKGVPGQSMHVSHGASPAKFRKVKVGSVP